MKPLERYYESLHQLSPRRKTGWVVPFVSLAAGASIAVLAVVVALSLPQGPANGSPLMRRQIDAAGVAIQELPAQGRGQRHAERLTRWSV